MAITKRQFPANTTMNRHIHQMIYPEYYTATSNLSISYPDFKYRFSLVDTFGVIGYFKQSPNISGAKGVFNPNEILKNSFDSFYFSPENTTSWNDVTQYTLKQYRVDVEEFYGGEVNLSSIQRYFKTFVLKCTCKDFEYIDFLLNTPHKRFLTNQSDKIRLKLRLEDGASIRFLNGTFTNINSMLYKSYPYDIRIKVIKGSVTTYYKTYANPWMSNQAPLNSSELIWDNRVGCVIEFPLGPKNLSSMPLYKYRVNNISYATPLIVNGIKFDVGDLYEVWAYNDGDVSLHYKFEVVCDELRGMKGVMIYWENEYGGWSQYLFNMINEEKNQIERFIYRKNYDEFGKERKTSSTFYIGHNDFSRELNVYGGEEIRYLKVCSDWITDNELYYLNDLWRSKNVIIKYNDFYFPVVILNEGERIKKNRKELYQLILNLEFSNKNIF